MPVQVIPPLYNMLKDEVRAAVADVRFIILPTFHHLLTIILLRLGPAIQVYSPPFYFTDVPPFCRRRVTARKHNSRVGGTEEEGKDQEEKGGAPAGSCATRRWDLRLPC